MKNTQKILIFLDIHIQNKYLNNILGSLTAIKKYIKVYKLCLIY
jgi:hypothetical protein